MTNNLPQARSDIRNNNANSKYDLTYGGVGADAGPGPYGSSLVATYGTQFWVAVKTGVAGTVTTEFSLPPGLYGPTGAGFGVTVVKGGNGTPVCDIVIDDPDLPAVTLATALPLGAATTTAVAFVNEYKFDNDSLSRGRTMRITVSGGTDDGDPLNFAMIGFDLRIVPTAWK